MNRPDPDRPPTSDHTQSYVSRMDYQNAAGDPMHMEFQGTPPAAPKPRKRRHIFRWVFLAVQAIFLIWIITGASSSAGTPKSCVGQVGEALKTCQDAGHAGTAVGVFLIVVVWACVDVVLALSWLIFRRRS